MSISFLSLALLAISLATNLTVEALKKLLDETAVSYSSNFLAVAVSAVLSCAASAGYLILNGIPIDLKIGVQIVLLVYLSFLVATLGYDKVIQMITQIQISKARNKGDGTK